MTEKYNIFIEGIQGSGKSTLVNTLTNHFPDYKVFREGDVSPVELAWCAYMNEEQYRRSLTDMPELKKEIESKSVKEGCHFVTPFTKISTQNFCFYQYMEKYEIYNGRLEVSAFKKIILQRFSQFQEYGNLFECSFFQNIIEELMLFALFSEEQIVDFYKEIISLLDLSKFKLIRLIPLDIERSIEVIKSERVNENGEEDWYSLMINYLSESPYGKLHHISTFQDMITHFKRRMELENKVLELLPDGCYLNIESKRYDVSSILDAI